MNGPEPATVHLSAMIVAVTPMAAAKNFGSHRPAPTCNYWCIRAGQERDNEA